MNKVHLTKTRPSSNIDISKHPVLLFPRSDYQNFEDGNETAFLEEEIHLKIDEVKEDKLDKEFEEDEKNDNKKESLKAKHVCDICGLDVGNSEAVKRHEKLHFQPNAPFEDNQVESSCIQSMDCTEEEKLKLDEKYKDSSKELDAGSAMYKDAPQKPDDRLGAEHNKDEIQSSQAKTCVTKR